MKSPNSLVQTWHDFRRNLRRLARLEETTHCTLHERKRRNMLRKRTARMAELLGKTRARAAVAAAIAAVGLAPSLMAQTPTITALNPDRNEIDVSVSANIQIDFSRSMDAATITGATIRIFGTQTGLRSEDGLFSGNPARFFNPDLDYYPGEKIYVTVTTDAEAGGTPLAEPEVYMFRAAARGNGRGYFAASTFDVGPRGRAAVIGDLDGDDDLDILVANSNNASYRVMRNQGGGTFTSFGFGSSWTFDVDGGDLDGDGDLDVIAANAVSQQTDILLNNGNGTFSTSHVGNADISRGVRIGDLDGDGDLDAIISNADAVPELLLNNGNGTFAASTIAGTDDLEKFDIGDLDGDGDLDAVFAGLGISQLILLNNGDATFASSTFGGTGINWSAAIGDLDGDDDSDVIIVGTGQSEIWLNNGDATFTSSNFSSSDSEDVVLGDLDGDGDLDAILANYKEQQHIWFNNGDGTFSSYAFGLTDGEAEGINLGDLDGDGDLDAVICNRSDQPVDLWFNATLPRVTSLTPSTNAITAVRGDDIVITFSEEMDGSIISTNATPDQSNITLYGSNSCYLTRNAEVTQDITGTELRINPKRAFFAGEEISLLIKEGKSTHNVLQTDISQIQFRAAALGGTGTFATGTFDIGPRGRAAVAADLDKDGDMDLLIANSNNASYRVMRNQGGGTFTSFGFGSSWTFDVDGGDLDGDGDMDVVAANAVSQQTDILLNNGNGTFATSHVGQANISRGVRVADLDNDGDLDFIISNGDADTEVFLNNGDASFTTATVPGDSREKLDVGDLNGDGYIDAIISGLSLPQLILLNNGDGSFATSTFGSGTSRAVAIGDLDGDGDLDAIIANNGAEEIWINNGDATFTSSSFGTGDSEDLAIGDLDGDGDLDAIIGNFAEPQQIWINNGDATFTSSDFGSGDTEGVTIADLDGDLDMDAVILNRGDQPLDLWFNQPSVPAITSITPSTTTASLGAAQIVVEGKQFYNTTASLTVLDSGGTTNGSIQLNIISGSPSGFTAQIPAGVFSTIGTLTLTVDNEIDTDTETITITNDTPLIATNNIAVAINEDEPTQITLTLSDATPGISGLVVTPPAADLTTIASISQQGATAATTSFLITPVANANGTVPLTFEVSDGAATGSTTINLTVTPVNDPPTIATNNTALTTDEDTLVTTWVDLNDIDTPFSNLVLTASSSDPSLIRDEDITFGATGATTSVDITPNSHRNGSANITITVDDGEYQRATTFNITVNPVNDPPAVTAASTTVTTDEDTATSTTVELSDRDTAVGTLQLTATSADQTLLRDDHMSFGVTGATTTLDLVPQTNANGSVLVTVSAFDGEFTRSTTFTFVVNPVNDPPAITAASVNVTTDEDTATSSTIELSDRDTNFSNLLLTATSSNLSVLRDNQISFGATGATTSINMDPATNANGSALVTVTVDDGEFQRSTSFTLTVNAVNDPPAITAANTSVTTDEENATSTSVTLFDRDTNFSNLILTATSADQTLLRDDHISFGVTGATTTLDLVPQTNANGSALVTVSVDDGEFTRSTTFTFVVNPVNDPPVITAANVNVTTDEDTATSSTVELFDRDTNFSNLVLTATSSNLSVLRDNQISFGATGATTSINMDPATNANGSALVTVTVDDGEFTRTTSFTLTVNAVDDPPSITAANAFVFTNEDTPTTTTVDLFDRDTPFANIELSADSNNPSLIESDGISFGATGATVVVTLTPKANAGDSALITITADDGSSQRATTFTLVVNPVNDPPVITAANVNVTTDEDTATSTTIELFDRDTDFSNLVLTATSSNLSVLRNNGISFGATGATTSINMDPATNANGSALVTVTVDDGEFQRSTSFNLTVNAVNDPPSVTAASAFVFTDEDTPTTTSIDLFDRDTPFANIELSATSSNPSLIEGEGISFGATGSTVAVNLTPKENAGDSALITVFADDGEFQRSTSFTLVVNPVNDPPTITAGTVNAFADQNSFTTVNIFIDDRDSSVPGLILSATSANQALLSDSGISFGATAGTVVMTMTSNCGQVGDVDVTVTVSDGEYEVSTLLTLTVVPINDLSITGATCACPDMLLTYTALPVDPTASHVWSVEGGTIKSGQGSGSIIVTWDNGATIATVSVDRTALTGCTSSTVLTGTPKVFRAVQDYVTVTSSSADIDVLNNDLGTGISLHAVQTPNFGSISSNGSVVTYTPDPGFAGVDVFEYAITSGDGCIATGAIVAAVSANPVVNANLEFVEVERNGFNGTKGLKGAFSAVVSPDGKFVYTVARLHHSIVIFSRDTSDGTLSYVDRVRNLRGGVVGLEYPEDIAMDPAGDYVFVAAYGDNAMLIFERDQSTGELDFVERKKRGQTDNGIDIRGLKRPRNLAVSPDGRNVYVSGNDDNSLAVFVRNDGLGVFNYLEVQKDGQDGVDGLRGARGVAVSYDGKQVYVAGSDEESIAMFDRDPADGSLSFVQRYREGVGGINGLDVVTDVDVSPDGRNVYAAGLGDDAVVQFSRSSADGSLTYQGKYTDGTNGISGLDAVAYVQTGPGGSYVWASSALENSLVMFKRDAATGDLTLMDEAFDGVDGFDGLEGARAFALWQTDPEIYVTGSLETALAVLRANQQPVATMDAGGSVAANGTEVISALSNDSDPDGNSLTITAKTDGALGTVAITGGGTTLDYTAGASTGMDSFTYTISDGHGGSSTATVSIAVVQPKLGVSSPETGDINSLLTLSPNPADKHVTVGFSLDNEAALNLSIVDLKGVERFSRDLGSFAAGTHGVEIQLLEATGADLPAGAYFVELGVKTVDGVEAKLVGRLVIK